MKKILSLLTISLLIAMPAFAENEINFTLQSHLKGALMLSNDYPEIFKPTGLNIGNSTVIKIKAPAGSFVSLLSSFSENGASAIMGNSLRLGEDFQTLRGVVPDNGVLEIALKIDNDKDLIGKKLYIEALTWKNKDQSDLKIAKVIGSDGRESESNAIPIKDQVASASGAKFSGSLPGFSQGMMDTINKIENSKTNKKQDGEKLYDTDYFQQKSVILRNMHSPDVEKNNE